VNTYMTEEEQIESMKRVWNKYGNLISSIILAIALVIVGYRWYDNRQMQTKMKASQTYEQLIKHFSENDKVGVVAQANYLVDNYPSTIYASGAQLLLARESVNNGKLDKAKAQLSWVLEHTSAQPIKAIATIRLARIESEETHYDKAIDYLNTVHEKDFLGLVHEVKGDVYHAKGEEDKAHQEYLDAKKYLPAQFRCKPSLLTMKINQVSQQLLPANQQGLTQHALLKKSPNK